MQVNFWGGLITELRKKKKVPQRRMAQDLRINRNSLRFIESGKQSPDILTMERILEYLGYELDAIEVRKPAKSAENKPCNTSVSP